MKRTFEISTAAVFLVLAPLVFLVLTIFNLGTPMDTALSAQAAQMPANGPSAEEMMAMARNITIGIQAGGLLLGLLAAFGLWRVTKWGFWLGVILAVFKFLGVVSLLVQAQAPVVPETFGNIAAGLIVLILLLLRDSRERFFPPR
jgi:hypothetical protein